MRLVLVAGLVIAVGATAGCAKKKKSSDDDDEDEGTVAATGGGGSAAPLTLKVPVVGRSAAGHLATYVLSSSGGLVTMTQVGDTVDVADDGTYSLTVKVPQAGGAYVVVSATDDEGVLTDEGFLHAVGRLDDAGLVRAQALNLDARSTLLAQLVRAAGDGIATLVADRTLNVAAWLKFTQLLADERGDAALSDEQAALYAAALAKDNKAAVGMQKATAKAQLRLLGSEETALAEVQTAVAHVDFTVTKEELIDPTGDLAATDWLKVLADAFGVAAKASDEVTGDDAALVADVVGATCPTVLAAVAAADRDATHAALLKRCAAEVAAESLLFRGSEDLTTTQVGKARAYFHEKTQDPAFVADDFLAVNDGDDATTADYTDPFADLLVAASVDPFDAAAFDALLTTAVAALPDDLEALVPALAAANKAALDAYATAVAAAEASPSLTPAIAVDTGP